MSGNEFPTPQRARLFQDRDRISAPVVALLLAVALVPLLLVTLRLMALAAIEPAGLLAIGDWLNRVLTLTWVQPDDRDVILYILLLPLAALLTAVVRLTLGIRVLGFRAILIAIGFQEIGPLPSLLLILIIAATVVTVRPFMRRVGMPLYARVAAILCIVAITMVLGLLAGTWLGSATLWSMAFFPVVILAMLAESVADTVARENLAMAAWRTGSTILLAAVLAGLGQLTLLRELALTCPELVVTQLVLIAFVSEFLDLRLLEGAQARLTNPATSQATCGTVVIARSRFGEPPLRRTTPEAPRRYRRASLQVVINELRDHGYRVQVVEGDERLPERLREEAQRCRENGGVALAVLNFAGGTNGAARLAQVPVLCEMLGVPYSGPAPQAPVLLDDRLSQRAVLRTAGLAVPRILTLEEAEAVLRENGAAVMVRPRFQPDRRGRKVRRRRDLHRVLQEQQRRYGEVLIDDVPKGTALSVILLGHGEDTTPKVLPLLEAKAAGGYRVNRTLDDRAQTQVNESAVRAAQALGCRDLTRVELHLASDGAVSITLVLAIELITPRSAATCAALAAGISAGSLAIHLVSRAIERAGRATGVAPTGPPFALERFSTMENRPCATSVSSVTASTSSHCLPR